MIRITALFILLFALAGAADVYVRDGGSGDGSAWNNALDDLPSSLTRGNTYYVADGNYGAHFFDDAHSGTTVITIKKATVADHGTSTGWSDAYGDGQAVFTAPLKFRKGYYTFDGSTRDENDWFDGSAYGFKVANGGGDYDQAVKVGGLASDGSYDYSGEPMAPSCIFKYVYVLAQVMPVTAVRSYQFDTESSTATTGFLVQRCVVENGNNHYFIRNSTGAIIEYSASWKAKNSPANHGEIFNCYYNTPNAIIRYNIVKDNYDPGFSPNPEGYYAGTAVVAIVVSDNVSIYGNIFTGNACTDASVGWNGDNTSYLVTNLKFYNNTIVNSWGQAGVILPRNSAGTPVAGGSVAYNNLWIDSSIGFQSATHNYSASDESISGEANSQTGLTTSIFTNYAGGDYTLAANTDAGTDLGSPYNVDMLGNTRTTWSRGAYEYQSGGGGSTTTVTNTTTVTGTLTLP